MQYWAKDMFLNMNKNKHKMQGKCKTLSSAKTQIEELNCTPQMLYVYIYIFQLSMIIKYC